MKKSSTLTIKNLETLVSGKAILKGISLTIKSGEVHAIMGPNGSGKSTLAYSLMGHPTYQNQKAKGKNQIKIDETDISQVATDERARAGLYLALQAPIAIPGVNVVNLLRSAYQAIHGGNSEPTSQAVQNPLLARRWRGNGMSLPEFTSQLRDYAKFLEISDSFLTRGIHDGFSGGEKKKIEMLEALVLRPKFAIFDEIDTGLDVDALRVVAKGIKLLAAQGAGVLVITHYQRILKYLKPDLVHVLVGGRLVESGKASLAKKIEEKGYRDYATTYR